jgi:hypothetical protein
MMITERSKRVIPFRPHDAKRVGEGCFYLDLIVWLNGDRIELGERIGFNYGCYVNATAACGSATARSSARTR